MHPVHSAYQVAAPCAQRRYGASEWQDGQVRTTDGRERANVSFNIQRKSRIRFRINHHPSGTLVDESLSGVCDGNETQPDSPSTPFMY